MMFPKPQRREKAPRKPLTRSRMRRKRARRIDRETPAERYYKGPWLHSRPCVGLQFTDHICRGPIQQMHFRDMTGASLKESNFDSVAGCEGIHTQYDQAKGPFAPMGREGRKQWFRTRIIETHADFVAEHGRAVDQ